MLKVEEVKAGDDLECIDIAEFSKIWGESRGYDINKMENISLLEIGPYYFRLKGKFLIGNVGFDEIRPSLDCLKYFKKKEQSQQYTFDDLINVAVQARKDKVLPCVEIYCDGLSATYIADVSDSAGHEDLSVAIEHIKSLYKETFVIESEEDIKRIKAGAKITLNNSNLLTVKNTYFIVEDHIVIDAYTDECTTCQNLNYNVGIVFLKGATVEQERGRDD